MKIRKATIKDAGKISRLRRQTLEKITSLSWKKAAVIDYLKKKNSTKEIMKKMKERDIYVATEKGKIIGSVDIKDNKIGGLFVRHDSVGKGIGKKLMEFIEKKAKKRGLSKVILHPTPNAIKFYKKLGYKKKKREIWKSKNFKTILWTMEKRLR